MSRELLLSRLGRGKAVWLPCSRPRLGDGTWKLAKDRMTLWFLEQVVGNLFSRSIFIQVRRDCLVSQSMLFRSGDFSKAIEFHVSPTAMVLRSISLLHNNSDLWHLMMRLWHNSPTVS
jgi:hypothetical protein